MASSPCYYKLDLAKLRDRFKETVPFSEWCELCETAGADGFPSHSLRKKSGSDLSTSQKLERLLGVLLYINISGAAGLWFGLSGLSFVRGYRRLAYLLFGYAATPLLLWSLLRRLWDVRELRNTKYDFPYRHQHLYLHMKYVWPAELQPPRTDQRPIIFCIAPHGVLPFGIDYAFFDKLGGRICRWVAAPVLFKLPIIRRYLKQIGVIPATAKGIRDAAANNENIGIVLDGVAGIFQSHRENEETAWLCRRKGIVKIALESGAALVPVYGFGHTALLTPILDPFRILERVSIKLDVSIVPFLGRYGWPMGPPRRLPVAMVMGRPVRCPARTEPSQEDIDKYHCNLLDSFKEAFDTHKAAYGWEKKTLKFV
mmetsp:Transcript_35988/g.99179  ORF Transcript_35988/g.99179 Transcript_35988/m.99179 type:complete len:370 (+) Transcript_35988:68-1177(+)|eukprot:CAMPEP_0117583148 /NCGR_PEP_ID=MMETSP0784-20121206/66845_1 /TAXON_ID=39447 /ORGANISM="" /LENGTH=369 /DNA_ID=CAMNT_0005383785 /DNA_START=66 /DNA_END=1175 /DNA_ORIENTATION=-